MSVYFIKGKGWRYDFIRKGIRHTSNWFKTMTEARQAESKKRKEVKRTQQEMEKLSQLEIQTPPQPEIQTQPELEMQTPTDMVFLNIVNKRLDHVRAYKSDEYYKTHCYLARRWLERWSNLQCGEIASSMVEEFLFERKDISKFAANKDLRYLRATFNFAKKKKLINVNPTDGIDFFPIKKKIKYVPPACDIKKIMLEATPDVQDYLWSVTDTMARVSEINRLCWDDVCLKDGNRHVVLYTRKKRGGSLTPRKVPMTQRLYEILNRRFSVRDKSKPWVFCNAYTDPKSGKKVVGPFNYRGTILKTLCKKADVKKFSFHALRHFGASIMDNQKVPIGSIQKILGHENRTTTEIYLHSIGDSEQEAIAAYERATENPHTNSHTAKKKETPQVLPFYKRLDKII